MPRNVGKRASFSRSAATAGPFLDRRMGDHALQPRILVGQLLDEGRLLEMQAGIDPDLGEDNLLDLDRPARLVEVLEEVGPVDLRPGLQPAVAQPLDVIEMDVAVDDRKSGHYPP